MNATPLLFRLSVLVVAAACVWAVLPIRRGSGWVRRLAIVILAAVCWRSNRQLLLLSRPARLVTSLEGREARWSCLRDALPAGTVVGYVGPVSPERIAVDYGFRPRETAEGLPSLLKLVSAESALAPVLVVNRRDGEYVVGDFGANPPKAILDGRYERIRECASGTALYRRKDR